LQRCYRNCSEDCRRCVGARYCNRVRVTHGGLTPPLLFARRSAARGIATFPMYKRTISVRSGGCKPAVFVGNARARMITPRFRQHRRTRGAGARGVSPPCVAATHLQRRYRHCSEDCRPACWSTPLRLRFRNARGLRQPLLFARVRPPTELRLLRCTNAHAQERGREPAVCRADALAKALPQLLGRLPAGVLANAVAITLPQARGGYAPRSWLYRRLCSAKVAFSPSSERRAPRAAGVSPPCVRLTHLQRRFRNCSADCRRCVGARSCHRVRATTGGLRPPALVPAKMLSCIAKVAFSPPSERRAPGAAGVSPPCGSLTHSRGRYGNCSADCRR